MVTVTQMKIFTELPRGKVPFPEKGLSRQPQHILMRFLHQLSSTACINYLHDATVLLLLPSCLNCTILATRAAGFWKSETHFICLELRSQFSSIIFSPIQNVYLPKPLMLYSVSWVQIFTAVILCLLEVDGRGIALNNVDVCVRFLACTAVSRGGALWCGNEGKTNFTMHLKHGLPLNANLFWHEFGPGGSLATKTI